MTEAEMIARIDALARTVEELRGDLAKPRSMRRTFRCSCGSTSLLHFPRLHEAGHTKLHDLALVKTLSVWTGVKTQGALDAFACTECGIVELHAEDLAEVVVDNKTVIRYTAPDDSAPAPGPFR